MGQLGLSVAMTPTRLAPGKLYRLTKDFRGVPNDRDAASMPTNPLIPAGTEFTARPYLADPQVDKKISEDGHVSGRRYDFTLRGEQLPAGCCRTYRALAEHLENVAEEV